MMDITNVRNVPGTETETRRRPSDYAVARGHGHGEDLVTVLYDTRSTCTLPQEVSHGWNNRGAS
jgi:hypothetical protein